MPPSTSRAPKIEHVLPKGEPLSTADEALFAALISLDLRRPSPDNTPSKNGAAGDEELSNRRGRGGRGKEEKPSTGTYTLPRAVDGKTLIAATTIIVGFGVSTQIQLSSISTRLGTLEAQAKTVDVIASATKMLMYEAKADGVSTPGFDAVLTEVESVATMELPGVNTGPATGYGSVLPKTGEFALTFTLPDNTELGVNLRLDEKVNDGCHYWRDNQSEEDCPGIKVGKLERPPNTEEHVLQVTAKHVVSTQEAKGDVSVYLGGTGFPPCSWSSAVDGVMRNGLCPPGTAEELAPHLVRADGHEDPQGFERASFRPNVPSEIPE